MKLFKSLLIAPAALGLLAPLSARAAELNLKDASSYSENVSIPTFDQIHPSDWAHKAITEIANSRGCLGLIPEGTISRHDAASILNSCIQDVSQISDQEQRLIKEFNPEIATIRSNINITESRISEFEAGGFSPTTSASFSANFAIGAVDGLPSNGQGEGGEEKVSAIYGYQIDLSTSFGAPFEEGSHFFC